MNSILDIFSSRKVNDIKISTIVLKYLPMLCTKDLSFDNFSSYTTKYGIETCVTLVTCTENIVATYTPRIGRSHDSAQPLPSKSQPLSHRWPPIVHRIAIKNLDGWQSRHLLLDIYVRFICNVYRMFNMVWTLIEDICRVHCYFSFILFRVMNNSGCDEGIHIYLSFGSDARRLFKNWC